MAAPPDSGALRHFTFLPPHQPVRGVVVLIHGHGDYSSRYEAIVDPFLRRGMACLSTDLPGHGESPGRRGHVPGIQSVDAIVARNLSRARDLCPAGPIALAGHSMGGLLALREILMRPGAVDFAWISSPLLRPESTRHPLSLQFLRLAGMFFPNLTVDTGVREESCRRPGDAGATDCWNGPLAHSKISLGWGLELIAIAREVWAGCRASPPSLPILFTQGLADPVCDMRYLRDFLGAAKFSGATHLEFPDLLHEPFADIGQAEVFRAIGNWLDARIARPEPSTDGQA